jgi:copper chaperone
MLALISDTPSPYLQEPQMTSATQPSETRTYAVQGMTCSHCVLSVREEVSEVSGVASVDVDLASGRLTVTGANVSDDAVRDAVADAGYEVAA